MAYVRNTWYVASWGERIVSGQPNGVTVLGEPIVLWRNEAGKICALEDRCVHRLAPLSLGRCEGSDLRCMYHGFRFSPDGRATDIPGQTEIPATARVRQYPVVEQDDWVWVWMGDASLADESVIPRVFGPSHPDWVLRFDQLDYAAEARLINDNLTDFSHISYVHAASFGATEDFAKAKTEVAMIEGGVRIQRWAPDQPPAGSPDSPDRLDMYVRYDYLVPGILRLTTKLYPMETLKRFGEVEPPSGTEILEMYSAQAVTPTGKKSSRYFFSNGWRAPADLAQVDGLWDITLRAFAEDNVMIEGQQRIIDLDPGRRIMPASGDKGTVLYNRLVDRLARNEQRIQA
jgi:phenylpropionate dioxygenase-like ring-hydroxylating dioxygenase large terminal subunit